MRRNVAGLHTFIAAGQYVKFGNMMQLRRCAGLRVSSLCVRWIRTSGFKRDESEAFSEFQPDSWQNYRVASARKIGTAENKRWPLLERIEAAGPGYINLARKTRNVLRQIDRILDVFEPGQLALSFNGGKDSATLLHLFIAACDQHPTHRLVIYDIVYLPSLL